MQTVFLSKIPQQKVKQIMELLNVAPGFLSAEQILDKNSGNELRTVFCHIKGGSFLDFSNFLKNRVGFEKAIEISEGVKL